MEAILLGFAYLYGSIPFVLWLGRWRGVDLRRAGTGKVGASNLWQTVAPLEGLAGALLDISKGFLPPLVAQGLGLPFLMVVGSALAGVLGQMWPLFLGFRGGRGVSAAGGALLYLAPRELLIAALPLAFGVAWRAIPLLFQDGQRPLRQRLRLSGPVSRSVPLGFLSGLVLIPPLCWAFQEPPLIILISAGLLLLVLFRRLSAGLRQDWPRYPDKGTLLLSRLLFDRNQP